MKLEYDRKADAVYVRFSEDKIVESEETQPGFVFDFDADGKIVGFELLDARTKLAPTALAEIAAAA
jgi:uncharacterized protein YuzE